jgi:four helix bundle protein
MQDYRNLQVWTKSHSLALLIYAATRVLPADERFGLASQLRRAASSIPANIAEGCGRGGRRELRHFLRMASGSASELEYHLLLATELGYLNDPKLNQKVAEIKRMLAALINRLTHELKTKSKNQRRTDT